MSTKLFAARNKYFAYEWVLVISSAMLLAIWPLPGTIALRHLLLLMGFLSASYVIWKSKIDLGAARCWPFLVFFGFFAWIIFHLIFLSADHSEQLMEITSLWVRAFLAAVMGLGLGLVIWQSESSENAINSTVSKDWFTNTLIAGFGGTVIIFFIRYLYEIYQTKVWLHFDFYMTPYAGKPPVVIFGVIFFSLALIKLKNSILSNFSRTGIAFSAAAVFLVVFAEYFANTKNGMVILLVPLAIFSTQFILAYRWNFRKIIFAIFLILPIVLTLGFVAKKHVDKNTAWHMLLEDMKMGIQIDKYSSWKDAEVYSYPVNTKGVSVNNSTYERSAWAIAAVNLIGENPLGYGLVHHSFGALALEKWPDFHKPIGSFRGASHSGLLDLALGVGIPGMLLILVPFGAAFCRASHQSYFWMQFVRWIFPVILIAYLITEVSNKHFIELLFFIVALCIGLTLIPVKTECLYSK
jgi:hypothetical protein